MVANVSIVKFIENGNVTQCPVLYAVGGGGSTAQERCVGAVACSKQGQSLDADPMWRIMEAEYGKPLLIDWWKLQTGPQFLPVGLNEHRHSSLSWRYLDAQDRVFVEHSHRFITLAENIVVYQQVTRP